jgi:hypothetical protein
MEIEKERERERQVTHNFHIFSHTGQILSPPEEKLTFLIKNNFSVKKRKSCFAHKEKSWNNLKDAYIVF